MSKAQFVPIKKERFIYMGNYILNIKRYFNTYWTILFNFVLSYDWKAIITDSTYWLVEVVMYGIILNISSNYFFNLPITVQGIVSHGVIIQITLMYITEIKNGTTTKKLSTESSNNK